MPDHRFHARSAAYTLGDIAKASGAELAAGADSSFVLEDVAPLDKAGPSDLTFLDNVRYKTVFQTTKAGACFVRAELADLAPKGVHLLISASPYKAYALAAQKFYPQDGVVPGQAKTAAISPSAIVSPGCRIDDYVVIQAGAKIGEGCWIEAGAVIGENVEIGDHCRIGAQASVSHALIGSHVRLYPGVRVGQDGFGFAPDPSGFVKVPQLGRVLIEDHVEIGANTTIDRGAGPDTVIGQGTWIDNLVQIGHNVRIGKGCIIVAQVGISGSTVVEDYVVMGGQAGITGHLHIGKGARIGAQAGVMRDVPAGEEQLGSPAVPGRQHMRQIVALNRLIKRGKTS